MRLRPLALTVAAGLLISLAPSAAEAAPRYRVTAFLTTAKADVGERVVIKGRVIGPKSAGKRLIIERQLGTGAWVRAGSVRTTQTSRYRALFAVPAAGPQAYRVVAPRSKTRARGVSVARALTGWRWLDLTMQTRNTTGTVTNGGAVIAGVSYPKALLLGGGAVYYSVAPGCTTLRFDTGAVGPETGRYVSAFSWSERPDPLDPGDLDDYGAYASVDLYPGAAARTVTLDVRGDTKLSIGGSSGAVVARPQLYCPVDWLPPAPPVTGVM